MASRVGVGGQWGLAGLMWATLLAAPFAGLADPAWWLALAMPPAAVALAAARSHRWPLVHGGLLAALALAAVGSGVLGPWPVPLVVAFAAYFALVQAAPPLRTSLDWPRWQRRAPNRATVALFVATVTLSVVALVLYAWLAAPDVADMAGDLGDLPPWAVGVIGVGFALVNPAVEEALYRGALFHALAAATPRAWAAIAGQGIAFGALHVAGFPGGVIGIVMAGAWGTALGVLRHRTGGLWLPWLAHVATNVVIYVAVLVLAADQGVI